MSDVNIRLTQINVPDDKYGRIEIDRAEALNHREPGRFAGIKAGTHNAPPGAIFILDADGNPDVISDKDNDRLDNKGWDVKYISGRHERERVATFTLGKLGDDEYDVDGEYVPFEGLREGRGIQTHGNKIHLRWTGSPTGQAYFRQWQVTEDGVKHESDWLGAANGKGFACGRQ